jgi:hypothetical protein
VLAAGGGIPVPPGVSKPTIQDVFSGPLAF